MKAKNPLYVVKGKDVLEASSLLDLLVKKFNLTPVLSFLNQLMKLLLDQVENFAMFKAVKSLIDQIVSRIREIGLKVGILTV
jgi:hypothetical protein